MNSEKKASQNAKTYQAAQLFPTLKKLENQISIL